ncbi:aromatic acid exporter family protein [Acholeplasma granularum]|uniref:aromatic acid exporter family protein n=1 Tax=Acholeplasma granularum TaxID=264635 RepID=UPI000471606C|nr:aromatic acid exporter family protein [Acholeplasma granularum]
MYKQILHTTIKLVIVAVISGLIAYFVGIKDYILVGTIGILSVSLTKKDTIKDGINRYLDVLMGLILSTVMFIFFGYHLVVLIIFLAIFINLSYVLKINVGLIPALVLVKHIFDAQDHSLFFILERVGIISISVGSALLINLFYPEFYNQRMKKSLIEVDQMLKDHLYMLNLYLIKKEDGPEYLRHYELLNEKISNQVLLAELGDKDKLFDNDHRYLAYLYMRRNQLNYINKMYECVDRIEVHHPFEQIVANYIKDLVADIAPDDNATKQLKSLKELKNNFRNEKLPKNRQEFETRALLFHILEDLEEFLNIKLRFHDRYPDFVIEKQV